MKQKLFLILSILYILVLGIPAIFNTRFHKDITDNISNTIITEKATFITKIIAVFNEDSFIKNSFDNLYLNNVFTKLCNEQNLVFIQFKNIFGKEIILNINNEFSDSKDDIIRVINQYGIFEETYFSEKDITNIGTVLIVSVPIKFATQIWGMVNIGFPKEMYVKDYTNFMPYYILSVLLIIGEIIIFFISKHLSTFAKEEEKAKEIKHDETDTEQDSSGDDIITEKDVNEIYKRAIKIIGNIMDDTIDLNTKLIKTFSRVFRPIELIIYLYDENSNIIKPFMGQNELGILKEIGTSVPEVQLGEGDIGLTAETKEPTYINEPMHHHGLIYPLYLKNSLIGVVALNGKKTGNIYGEKDIIWMDILNPILSKLLSKI